tara:strand:+ start:1581 stop:2687 length:1107 start_codon:yes stop_codon:yes gene_type:complete
VKYYIIAGEASGDLHGSNLIKELKKIDSNSSFRCWGGDLINKETNNLYKHYKDYSYMGFLEVFLNLKKIMKNISLCKKDILSFNPDAIIYVDFPGFNLRIAKWAKSKNFINHFYISPQIWAWKQNRIKTIKRVIDQMYVILPFEKKFYEKLNFNVHYVGHPLLDAIKNSNKIKPINEKIVALLPGSRDQEINKILPIMLSVIKYFKEYKFIICAPPSKNKKFFKKFLKKYENNNVQIVENKTYNVLRKSSAALVTSGTATLEAALIKTPQIVCYKSSWISYRIGKLLLNNIRYISLVNLILKKEAVKELIQEDLNKNKLKKELSLILNSEGRQNILKSYKELNTILNKKGASKETATRIYKYHFESNS